MHIQTISALPKKGTSCNSECNAWERVLTISVKKYSAGIFFRNDTIKGSHVSTNYIAGNSFVDNLMGGGIVVIVKSYFESCAKKTRENPGLAVYDKVEGLVGRRLCLRRLRSVFTRWFALLFRPEGKRRG